MALIIAHRGFSGKYPENTMLAIRKAIELGVDGVELDVRATKDGKLVLFHDKKLKRITGQKGSLANKSYHELRSMKVRRKERIPLLEEAIDYMKRKRLHNMFFDIKVKGFEKEIVRLVKRKGIRDRTVLSSDFASVLVKFRALDKKIRISYIIDNRPDKLRTWRVLNKKIGLYSLNYFHERPISTKRLIHKVKKNGLKSMAWFIIKSKKQDSRMAWLLHHGVDGIITDYPDKLKKIIDRHEKHNQKR